MILCVLLASAFLSFQPVAHARDAYDDFESGKLKKIWSARRTAPNALRFEQEVVRKGSSALGITIHSHDYYTPADKQSKATERDELSEAEELISQLDRAYSYQFSLYIPKDFPIVPTRLVLAQWKQDCPRSTCLPDSPVVALRYVSGELYVTAGGAKKVIYRSHEDVMGRWLDFKFEIRFTRKKDGFVKVWLGGKNVGEFNGPTAFSTAGGYPDKARFYFKMGLYRDLMNEPMTIYVDEYRKADLPDHPPRSRIP